MGTGLALDPTGTRVLRPGTPVLIVGRYDFDARAAVALTHVAVDHR